MSALLPGRRMEAVLGTLRGLLGWVRRGAKAPPVRSSPGQVVPLRVHKVILFRIDISHFSVDPRS